MLPPPNHGAYERAEANALTGGRSAEVLGTPGGNHGPSSSARRLRQCEERRLDRPICRASLRLETRQSPSRPKQRSRLLVALAPRPARQIAISFYDSCDRFLVLFAEDRTRYRLAERLRKLIPVVAAIDSRRFHALRGLARHLRLANFLLGLGCRERQQLPYARRRRLYNPGAVGGSRLTQAIGGDKQIPTSNEDHLGLQFNQRV